MHGIIPQIFGRSSLDSASETRKRGSERLLIAVGMEQQYAIPSITNVEPDQWTTLRYSAEAVTRAFLFFEVTLFLWPSLLKVGIGVVPLKRDIDTMHPCCRRCYVLSLSIFSGSSLVTPMCSVAHVTRVPLRCVVGASSCMVLRSV